MKAFSLIFTLTLLISGCAAFLPADNSPTSPPVELSATAANTLTPSPAPTSTTLPTPTTDPNADVFTVEQKEKLYRSSLQYLAPSDGDAINVALALKYVPGADPSNMCGPLAVAILKSAGLLPASVDLHDFWLLSPQEKQSRTVLEKVFPAAQYADSRFEQPIDTFDFKKFPLKAGDFLYIYAGRDGSFEHMLSVTRVDEMGRAYTVTNIHTDSFHFAIREVALYDLTQPGVGQFYDWTNKKNYQLGITGLGGFEVWRRTVPLP